MNPTEGKNLVTVEDGTLFDQASTTEQERLRTQLGAVALLVARSDRETAHHDILVSTILEVLESRPLQRTQIRAKVSETWPSLHLSDTTFDEALDSALRTNHVGEVSNDAHHIELLDLGRKSLASSQQFAQTAIKRFTGQVGDQLSMMGIYEGTVAIETIAGLTIGALRALIADAFRTDNDTALSSLSGALHVAGVRPEAVEEYVGRRTTSVENSDRVMVLVNLALDHGCPLGNEIVHDLVVGHLLYVFMSRRDLATAAATAGPLSGEVLILDTPILVRLLAPSYSSDPLRNLLANARSLGVDVVLYQRTVDELTRLLDGNSDNAKSLENELRKGADPALLAELRRSDEVIWNWLQWRAGQTGGRDVSFQAWRESERGDGSTVRLLKALGIETRPDDDYGDNLIPAGRFAAFRDQIKEQIDRTGARHRHDEVIRHDALNLTSLWWARETRPAGQDKIWPGGFVLSPDLQINIAYSAVMAGSDALPAALTFPQFAQILGSYQSPKASEKLAFDLADGIAEHILIGRAIQVDPEQAALIAQAIGTDPTTSADIEQLKLDLRASLADESSRNGNDRPSDREAHAGLLVERLRERHRAAAEADREHARAAELEHESVRSKLQERTASAERLSDTRGQELETTKQQLRDAEEKSKKDTDFEQRRGIGLAILVGLVCLVVGLGIATLLFPAIVAAAAALVWLYELKAWARRERTFLSALVAVLFGIAGIWPIIEWIGSS